MGHRVAAAAKSAGHQVYATTRHRKRAEKLEQSGFHPLIVDWTDRRTMADLPPLDQILVAVSYDQKSRISRFDSQVGGLGLLLDVLNEHQRTLGHLCYISTTGVYHQSDGRWVDESSPTNAIRAGGRVHLQAESLLQHRRPRGSATVLRLAGIYGPGRVPRVADVIAGRPIESPGSGYLNLIHVDDAADAVMAVWHRANQGLSLERVYAVADDKPVVREDFYREIARQCRAPDPCFRTPPGGTPISARTGSNKRIWNRRMKRDLLPRLRYPTYREGLAHVLANQTNILNQH